MNQQHRRPKVFRRNILSNPRAQFKLIAILGGIFVVTSAIVCLLVNQKLKILIDFFYHSPLPPSEYAKAFENHLQTLFLQIAVSVVAMCGLFIFSGLYLTHRFTGPILKLENELAKYLAGGPKPKITFRKGDEFQDLPDLINQLLEK